MSINRSLLSVGLAVCLSASHPVKGQLGTIPYSGAPASGGTTMSILPIGAGGFVTGIDIASDGTKVVRADTYGGYYFNPSTPNCGNAGATGCWQQIVTTHSMPSNFWTQSSGVYEIVIAPSNSSHFYMNFNGYMLSSTNKGATWSWLSNWSQVSVQLGDATRLFGKYMAVDPANENIAYAGTPTGGVQFTTNGGASWTQISTGTIAGGSIPSGSSQGGGNLIAFDPTSPVIGGVTQGIYIFSYGTGLYSSTNGGATWAPVSGTPTTAVHLMVDVTGVVWVIANDSGSGQTGSLHRLVSGTWTSVISSADSIAAVAYDPGNCRSTTTCHIFALSLSTQNLFESTTSGSSFNESTTYTLTSTDIPWLAVTGGSISVGDIKFDATQSSQLWLSTGIGAFNTTPPTNGTNVTWVSRSAAIEQLDVNVIVSPPNGVPAVAVWDRCAFQPNGSQYPSHAGIEDSGYANLPSGWSIDYASNPSPNTVFIAVICHGVDNVTETSGYCTTSSPDIPCASWTAFASVPATQSSAVFGGCIATSTPNNMLWLQSNQPAGSPVWYTANGGTSWSNPDTSLSAVTNGWPANYYWNYQPCAADRVSANTFYLYNFNTGSGVDAVYRSTNSGLTWTTQCTACAGGSNFTGQPPIFGFLKAVPGKSGHLFWASGGPGESSSYKFYQSTNAGVNWAALANVSNVWAFDIGATGPGKSYPSIFIAGSVNGIFGMWRSDDEAVTWININNGFPTGNFNNIKTIAADANNYGGVYACFGGSGCVKGTINYLLSRDLDPASNDNTPVWLEQAA
jgi:hypothetical protein